MPTHNPRRKWLQHEVPENIPDSDPVLFITICCQERDKNQLAKENVWKFFEDSILHRNRSDAWNCTLFLAMPDHVHGIFRFDGNLSMRESIADWKRWTATKLALTWQKGFFDHRLRDQANIHQKRAYILQNPVRANLVTTPEDWPYLHDTFTADPR